MNKLNPLQDGSMEKMNLDTAKEIVKLGILLLCDRRTTSGGLEAYM